MPSFGKELFLGRFRLDLIHPHPQVKEEDRQKGEAFLAKLEAFLKEEVDPLEIEREARIPERVVKGLKELGALGMKIDEEYGGLGLSYVYYNRALRRTRHSAHCSARTSRSVSRSPSNCSERRSRRSASFRASPATR
jgi:alkylation response protein AidB-like acyl-CoA dehydrogenase